MADILDILKTYPDDPTVVMSRRVVNKTISEIERLRAEREQKVEAMAAVMRAVDMKIEAEAERDALRENSLAVLTRVRAYRDKVITERDALRAELTAEREKVKTLEMALERDDGSLTDAERDALRELLREAAEKLQPISALVDMTPSGFPDHDICPIRLGMARDLRELRARIDAALNKGGADE